MIAVTFQCDFGLDTAKGATSTQLPSGWGYVTLSAFNVTQTFLACPLHTQFQVQYVAPPIVITPDPVPVQIDTPAKPPSLQGL